MDVAVISLATREKTTLGALCANRPVVFDFWNTRCTKCPAALSKVDGLAGKASTPIAFVACAMSLGSPTEGTIDDVEELIGLFPNLEHVYLEYESKEQIKAALGFAALPFAAVYDANARLVFRGDPTSAEFAASVRDLVAA